MRPALAAAALALLVSVVAAVPARAGVATDQLREYTDAVVRVLEDPALKADDRRADRRAAVRRIATEIFDVQETARRALGTHWRARTPAQRDEFVALFAELLEHSYISQIDRFGGERLRFTDEKVDGENAVVRARVVTRQQAEVPIEARMVRRNDRWLVYDVLVENLSLIANYRAQFDRIIRTSSYEELVRLLRNPRRTLG